ncbi:MmpS family transport accessory protein [Mycobacterium simiae]|uniref:MmpS family transport accessory protein n=1 Tax=Mycobacterium simiae TaxID=1784 RepID=UPI00261C91C7|nr:MmpS family transport accessory protein [Mycobacterium simiae]
MGTIRNTLDDRPGLVRGRAHDYPDDDAYAGADYDGYGDDGYAEDDYAHDEYDEYDEYRELLWPVGSWRPAVALLGAIIAIGAIATAVIINSGDSASTKGTVAPAPTTLTSAPRSSSTPTASRSPSPSTSVAGQLPPETVTTLTTPSAAPAVPPLVSPPPAVVPPMAAVNPNTVYYSVTGTKQLLDLVNVVYTDARGYPQTEFNVSLPWTKVVVLNPGVTTRSVVATSIVGRLNCAIVNAEGQVEVASANNSNLATCTR